MVPCDALDSVTKENSAVMLGSAKIPHTSTPETAEVLSLLFKKVINIYDVFFPSSLSLGKSAKL